MTKPIIKIHDVTTGEVIERDMNAAELEQYAIDQAYSQAKAESQAGETSAKAALLERLGITADEAKLLLG